MSSFFIDRPIFAWVIAIVIMLGGLLALNTLPISQYPDIAPTTVRISGTYPGADAQTVENSVTKVIESGMTGIDHLDYMSATSTSIGRAEIVLTFTSAADPDVAQMQVQNKLQLVTPQLPQAVQDNGLTVNKSSSGFLLVIGFISETGDMTQTDLADYVDSTLIDTLNRVEGVGETQVFGSGYAMRIWLDPDKLSKYALMPGDIAAAVQSQNTQVSAGQLGGLPAVEGQQLNATVTARSRLQTPEQFRNIILKSTTEGSIVRLNDVARVEIGSESYNTTARYQGQPAAGVGVSLATGANALSTAQRVRDTIERMRPTFPAGVTVVYPYDTTPFVRLSIEEVVKTLIEAIVLVFIVMFVFLQNIRATIIPTLAVPVVLLGTFGVLAVFGFSINTLTMFAMVLAIGLLVDDAIVVVENVERVMHDEKLPPREATRKSMREITGALIGIVTVLSAVFIPMAFFGGSVGVIYRQFSVTIVSAMVLSLIVALVLTPALCATILKPPPDHATQKGPFGWFNRMFDRTTRGYHTGTGAIVHRSIRFVAVFLAIVVAAVWLFEKLPGSFLPEEDQGFLIASATLPAGATQDRTLAVLDQIDEHFRKNEAELVESVFTVAGFGFGGRGQNVGLSFIRLKPFDERDGPGTSAQEMAGRAMPALMQIKDARVFALAPPAIRGLGNTNGFNFYLQDINGAGHDKLIEARNQLLGLAGQSKLLANTRPNGQEDTPQFSIDIDQERASAFGIGIADINQTVSIAWGSDYVNDFIDRGRVKPVYLQADKEFRMQPEDVARWHVRNSAGQMVPFSSFSDSRWTFGSPRVERYNGSSAVEMQGSAAAGISSGEAMDEIERLIEQLPAGFSFEWTGLSYQEKLSGNQATALYAISMLVVFLSLAALYESWATPLAVMLSVPIGFFGAVAAALYFGQTNDVYFKVGLLTTIGLAAKNAILIVEFALAQLDTGKPLVEATQEAARQRLRPILMTSFAFILGVTPLAIANGPGSGAQNSIGIGVMGGMIAATFLGIFFVPLLFVVVRRIFRSDKRRDDASTPPPAGDQNPAVESQG
ncbi:multidrug efflux pump [Rhodobium orientis]|uniref:Efflux pump membrane transporter n=1 Tax=Rhodobium orientis TaxID=34017 RepID=A0A327JLQ6_9HYPH|nr:efflux RND transporter permease subunit [Rhodobium orientis]MBB4305248.1 multidrug efflux pump [Rhodobium orientis]MBK5952124.1 hydrophobe/amphiphile efflux-1 family RND transporter [Rhodobium orientis]RAI26324.1 hydrophobe/amphiphile efflux-1 family RND transporter [Rhodobium orientis]